MNKPTPEFLFVEDFRDIVEAAQEYIDYIDSDEYNDDRVEDYEESILEAVLLTVYGKNIFDWTYKRIESHQNANTPSARDY